MRLYHHAIRLLAEAGWIEVTNGVVRPTDRAYETAPAAATRVEFGRGEDTVIRLATALEWREDAPRPPSIDTDTPKVIKAIAFLGKHGLVDTVRGLPRTDLLAVRDYLRALSGTDPAALEAAIGALREYLANRR